MSCPQPRRREGHRRGEGPCRQALPGTERSLWEIPCPRTCGAAPGSLFRPWSARRTPGASLLEAGSFERAGSNCVLEGAQLQPEPGQGEVRRHPSRVRWDPWQRSGGGGRGRGQEQGGLPGGGSGLSGLSDSIPARCWPSAPPLSSHTKRWGCPTARLASRGCRLGLCGPETRTGCQEVRCHLQTRHLYNGPFVDS